MIDFSSLIQVTLPNIGSKSLGEIVSFLLPYIFGLAGFALLISIIWGGFQVLTSQGDPKTLESGREKITYAVVGFLVMFTAYWVMKFIARILDLQSIRSIFS